MKWALYGVFLLMCLLAGCQDDRDFTITIIVPDDAAGVFRIREDEERGKTPTHKKGSVVYRVDGEVLLTTDTSAFEKWHKLLAYRKDGSPISTINAAKGAEREVVLRCIGTVENDVVFHIGTFEDFTKARDRVLQNAE